VSASHEPFVVPVRSGARRIIEALREAYIHPGGLQRLGYVVPEEFEQLSTNGACGKQQAEPERGTVLDASSMQSQPWRAGGFVMQCPRCQHENRPGSKFCLGCGASLGLVCTSCGTGLPTGSRFCDKRGTAVKGEPASQARFTSPETYTPKHLAEKILTSRSALEGERKQVTVLFADLKGSMELLADRDPEEARKLLDPVLERMMEAVHRYEGTVNQVMGDGIMALFGAPLAHEDHAVRAGYAALRMQEA
jgi:hypothetical protein